MWTKAAVVGLAGSLVMFVLMMAGIHVAGIAPFQLPPSAAFLVVLGLNVGPVALLVHLGYGAFWSLVLVGLFGERTTVGKGLSLALFLWLVMMLVYSPMIGWGVFGVGSSGDLPSKLQLETGPKYAVMTGVLHLIYGLIIGWLNPLWIEFRRPSTTGAGLEENPQ